MQSEPVQFFVDPLMPDFLPQTSTESPSPYPYALLGQDDTDIGRQGVIDDLFGDQLGQVGGIALAQSESRAPFISQHDIQQGPHNDQARQTQSNVAPMEDLLSMIGGPAPSLGDPWQDFDDLLSKKDAEN